MKAVSWSVCARKTKKVWSEDHTLNWSSWADSNRWPARYEWAALPTEPQKHTVIYILSSDLLKVNTMFENRRLLFRDRYNSRLSRSMIWCRVFGTFFIDNVVLYRFAGLFRWRGCPKRSRPCWDQSFQRPWTVTSNWLHNQNTWFFQENSSCQRLCETMAGWKRHSVCWHRGFPSGWKPYFQIIDIREKIAECRKKIRYNNW